MLQYEPILNADESIPYPTKPLCHYTVTKMMAEQYVLAANGKTVEGKRGPGLLTCGVRPGGLFGPRDALLTEANYSQAPGIGLSTTILEYIYVENVVHAMLLLERALTASDGVSPGIPAGKAYFIGDEVHQQNKPKTNYVDWNQKYARALGLKHTFKLVPAPVMTAIAHTVEFLTSITRGYITPYLGQLACVTPPVLALSRTSWFFTHARAVRDFNYAPLYSVDEAMAVSAQYWAPLLSKKSS